MKKIKIKNIFRLFLIIIGIFIFNNTCYSEDSNSTTVLKSGILRIEQVPNSFMGTWRVVAQLDTTNTPYKFKRNSIDVWNLIRQDNVIILENPFSGAKAEINISYASQNKIKFTKVGKYDSKILTDTVELRLNGSSFTGINEIKLDSLSEVNGTVIQSDSAKYILKGEKISGMSILEK